MDRFCKHLSEIKINKSTNVARHFNSTHGGDLSLVQVQIIDNVKTPQRGGDTFHLLCKRDVFWNFKLQTRIPNGLNFEWDVTHYYE